MKIMKCMAQLKQIYVKFINKKMWKHSPKIYKIYRKKWNYIVERKKLTKYNA